MNDRIIIKALDVSARIGVPDAERAAPQRLEIDLELECDCRNLNDDVTRTTDYAAVAAWVAAECGASEFRLVETLAGHLADGLLAQFPRLKAAGLEVRKFALPAAAYAGVRLRRERN